MRFPCSYVQKWVIPNLDLILCPYKISLINIYIYALKFSPYLLDSILQISFVGVGYDR